MAQVMSEIEVLTMETLNSGTSWTRNENFEKDGYLVIKDLWDPEELYHPLPAEKGLLNYYDRNPDHFNYQEVEGQVDGCLSRYWHPQYRTIHSGVRKKLEKEIGRKLYNTYYYDRYYFPGQALAKHSDRPACEISVTVHISTNLPEPERDWPIWIKTPDTYVDKQKSAVLVPGENHSCILNPGDGMVYKGCERPHWREALPTPRKRRRDVLLRRKQPDYYYHQIFFHYVIQDGLRASSAWDKSS